MSTVTTSGALTERALPAACCTAVTVHSPSSSAAKVSLRLAATADAMTISSLSAPFAAVRVTFAPTSRLRQTRSSAWSSDVMSSVLLTPVSDPA